MSLCWIYRHDWSTIRRFLQEALYFLSSCFCVRVSALEMGKARTSVVNLRWEKARTKTTTMRERRILIMWIFTLRYAANTSSAVWSLKQSLPLLSWPEVLELLRWVPRPSSSTVVMSSFLIIALFSFCAFIRVICIHRSWPDCRRLRKLCSFVCNKTTFWLAGCDADFSWPCVANSEALKINRIE